MRSLHADLLAACKSTSATPVVTVTARNEIGAVRRHDFTTLDSTANASGAHDAAVAGDASVTRVRMDAGTVKQQRVTTPATGPWTSWNNLETGRGTRLAICSHSARVLVAFTDAANTGIYVRESTDNGSTYGAATLVVTAASTVTDLAIAMKNSSGDAMLVWGESTGALLKVKDRTSGTWGTTFTSPASFNSMNGIAVCHGADWDIVIAGVEVTTLKPTLWSYAYGDGFNLTAATWGTLRIQAQAENAGGTSYLAPFVAFTDAYRITFVQSESFTGGLSRCFRATLHPDQSWTTGPYSWTTPTPTDYTDLNGLAVAAVLGASSGHLYESGVATVKRAPVSLVTLDLSADVLEIDAFESTAEASAEILLNNDAGQYVGPPSSLAIGNAVTIAWGYYTASGNRTSEMQTFWIRDAEHVVDGRGRSRLRLRLESGFGLMARNLQRTQIIETSTPQGILLRCATRAGLYLSGNGSSSRSGTLSLNNVIAPGVDGLTAARRMLALIADRLFMMAGTECRLTEPLTGDTTDYTFGTDHPIRSLRWRTQPAPVGEVFAHGAGATGQASDFALVEQNLAPITNIRDITSTTGATANATATAHLRQRKLDEPDGVLVAQPHVGLEPLDVIALDQPLVSGSTITARVMAIRWQYTKRRSILDQTLTLGPK